VVRLVRPAFSLSSIPALGCVLLLVIYLGPMALAILTSLKPQAAIYIYDLQSFWPLSASTYSDVIGQLLVPLENSLIIATGATVLAMALATGAAYALARMESSRLRRAADVFLGALLLLQLIPQASAVIPLYGVLVATQLANTLVGVIIADAALLLPLAILVLRPHFISVPLELEDAAKVDGAGTWSIFWRVVLPLARNGLLVVGAIVFALVWGEFIYAITFLASDSLNPVSVVLLNQVTHFTTSWNGVMAVAVIATVPVVCIFAFTQRELREGISAGAIR
jgi:multiple sugar transport system permease protein